MIPKNNVNTFLTSVYSLCGVVMFIMLITCLVLSLAFIKLVKKKARCLEDDVATPTYKAEMDTLKVDLSLNFCDRTDIDNILIL